MGRNQRRRVCFVEFSGWQHGGEACRLRLHLVTDLQQSLTAKECLEIGSAFGELTGNVYVYDLSG